MFTKKINPLIILLIAIMTGCSNSNPTTIETQQLIKISSDANNYKIFEYQGDALKKYEEYINGDLTFANYFELSYDNLVEWEEYKLFTDVIFKKYQYDSLKRPVKMDLYYGNKSFCNGYLVFLYNEYGQVVKREQYSITDTSVPWNYDIYEYDANGNILSINTFVMEKLAQQTTYIYDNMRNPFYGYRKSYINTAALSKNNITRIYRTEYYNNSSKVTEINISYTYNKNGYPATRTTNSDDVIKIETYIYQ